jgi:RND superfamily putative drug exporter
MSTFLYRLGRWASTHAWLTLGAWVVLLAVVGTLAATIGRPLTSQVSIPGTQFEKVVAQLGTEIPEAAGGFGRVVLTTDDGRPFTDAQKAAVREAFAAWEQVPHVERVVDPFDAQQQQADGAAQLEDARTQLDTAKEQVDSGREQLNQAKGQLAGGEALLQQLRAENPDDPTIPDLEAQVAEGKQQLADGEQQFTEGEQQYLAGEQQYQDGVTVAEASSGVRLVNDGGSVAVVQIQFDDNAQSIPTEDRNLIPEQGDPVLRAAGVTPYYSVEITQQLEFIGPGEILGLAVALLVLVLVLGSLVAAGLPLLVALLGVGVGLGGAMALTSLVEMNNTTPALALMLGLAVGIDYALFIVNRHRANLLHGVALLDSIARSVATAGSAVVFAGTTVVIALAALVLSGIPILAELGLVAAATVAIAVLVAVSVSPAVLRLMGTRVISRRAWRAAGFHRPGDPSERASHRGDPEEEHGAWFVRLVTRAPWLTVLGVVGVVGVLAIPAASMRLGLPDGGSEPTGSSAYTAYSTIGDEFGAGMNGPIVAVATLPAADGTRSDAAVLHEQAQVVRVLTQVDGVASVVPFGVSEDTNTLAFQVVPATGPADVRTRGTVDGLQTAAGVLERHDGIEVGLTGQTIANIEISDRLAGALPTYLVVVVGLSLLILMVVFRSLVVPAVATGGFLLTIAAAFGATTAVHQWGWLGSWFGVTQPGPLLSFMPIILIGVLFGLAMDYQMFLVSGMHEAHAHGQDARAAVRSGFVHGVKVVTAAAIIMSSVFLGFAYSHIVMVRPIGFGLAIGVLVDAFLVRMTLTPALMHLLGERAWYLPRWLDRLLPDLDVEGLKLTERLRSGALAGTAAEQPEPETVGSSPAG